MESATEVADLFKKSVDLFSVCHNTCNAKYATTLLSWVRLCYNYCGNDNIHSIFNLGLTQINIKNLLSHYREYFCDATILPKMHMLEDHIVPWMQHWHVASGLNGGAGSRTNTCSHPQLRENI